MLFEYTKVIFACVYIMWVYMNMYMYSLLLTSGNSFCVTTTFFCHVISSSIKAVLENGQCSHSGMLDSVASFKRSCTKSDILLTTIIV